MKKSIFLLLVTVMFTVLFVQSGRSQTPHSNMPVTNGNANELLVDNSYAYIAGEFSAIGKTMNSCALQVTTTNSTPTTSFPTVTGGTSVIKASVSDGNGGWYIGGDFTGVGGTTRNHIAHLKSDGTLDATWNPNMNNTVNSLLVIGTDLYVAGTFTIINGSTTRNRLAKISLSNNTTGTVNATWNPNSSAEIKHINTDGTYIYVGTTSAIGTIGGIARKYIGRVNTTTGALDSWNPITTNGATIFSMAFNGTDLYIGGTFSSINGTARSYVAKLSTASNTLDASWYPVISGGWTFNSLIVLNDNLYIAGNFTTVSGLTRNRLAKISLTGNPTGTVDADWNPNVGTLMWYSGSSFNTDAYTLTTDGTNIYAGGYFLSVSGKARSFAVKLNTTTGAPDNTWIANPSVTNASSGSSYAVFTISVSNGKVFIGGSNFNMYNALCSRLGRIDNVTGLIDYSWFPDPNGTVNSLLVTADAVYAGGFFTAAGGVSRSILAKLNKTDGSADANFNASISGAGWISCMAYDNSTLYFGGKFTGVGDQTRGNVASVNSSTGAYTSWTANANWSVSTIVVNGSYVYLGGDFTTIGGVAQNYITRIDKSTGVRDASFAPAPNSQVYIIIFDESNNMYLGGNFTTISSTARGKLARYNSSMVLDATWNPNLTPTPDWGAVITTIAVTGTSVYVGGGWENGTIGGVANLYKAAKLNKTNGNADATWNPNPNGSVTRIRSTTYTLLDAGGTDIYLSGSFTTIKGVASTGLVFFSDRPLPVSLSSFTSNVSGQNVNLRWVTSSETNNTGFNIERKSADGNWSKIGFVSGKGTTNTQTTYTFTDTKLSTGKYQYRLKQIDNNGNFEYHNLNGEVEVGVPTKYEISQNYPNPFNPMTKIDFQLPNDGKVSLKIYDITGREIAVLVNNEFKKADYYTVMFNGSSLSSGVYFYRIEADKYVMTKKMVLVK